MSGRKTRYVTPVDAAVRIRFHGPTLTTCPTVPLFLVESRWLRIGAFTAFYFAQGVPIGLLAIAVPAWLSERGMSLGEIATYISVVSLPWGFKLVSGPLMDRFSFPAMGRRRPWVMGAQGGLTLALASLMLVTNPQEQLGLVIALGFLVNSFAAVQDVAVDGMAIDVLPETERGRVNAFMAFGQVAGFSSFSAVAGYLLSTFGLAAAAAAAALTVAAVFALITVVRERRGERALPWSEGGPAAHALEMKQTFASIFKGLARVLLMPMSLLLMAAEWLLRMRDGVALAVFPVVATQQLEYSAVQYSYLQGIMGVVVAVVGVGVGPIIDRYGAKWLYIIGLGGVAVTSVVFASTQPLWDSTPYAIGMWSLANLFTQVVFVSFIACSMSICWGPVAASQFAIYMSLSNLARSAGGAAFAPVANDLTYPEQFLLMAALAGVACVSMLFFRPEPHRARLRTLAATATPTGVAA